MQDDKDYIMNEQASLFNRVEILREVNSNKGLSSESGPVRTLEEGETLHIAWSDYALRLHVVRDGAIVDAYFFYHPSLHAFTAEELSFEGYEGTDEQGVSRAFPSTVWLSRTA